MIRRIATFFQDLPLRNKLLLLFVLLTAIVLVLAGAIFILSGALSFQREQRQNLASLAAVIAENSSAHLVFDDQLAARQLLRGLASYRHIEAAYLLRDTGRLFASYERLGVEIEEGMAITPSAAPAANLVVLQRYLEEEASRVIWCAPIGTSRVELEGQHLGTVLLISSNAPFLEGLFHQGLLAVAVFLLSVGMAYLLATRLQRLISAPILRLTDTMHHVSLTKDFSVRAEQTGSDEISRLFTGFNDMLCEIEERNDTLRQRQELLHELAHFDGLTGLPNRTLFFDRLNQSLRNAERFSQTVLVAFIDLDHFKHINDSLGHRVGDLLLVEVAHRLKDVIRSCDTVARLGGDEFTVFAQNIGKDQNAEIIAKHLVETLARPYLVEKQELYVTASIGLTLYPKDGDTADELLRNADLAMYCAKDKGKNAYECFDPAMNLLASSRLTILNDLHHALQRNEFWLAYQPRVDLVTSRITGLEALIRWQHPKEGLVMPGKFIHLAEENGLIVEISQWVIATACCQLRKWQSAGLKPPPVAVNIPSLLFKREMVVSFIVSALEEYGIDPGLLEIELTEGTILGGNNTTIAQLDELKAMGIIIAIDDFGTGYSSLSYLQRLPIDILKIDRSFIWNISSNEDDLAIVKAIIAMARSLSLTVVAEGVEQQDQLEFLRTHGCEQMQGYLASRPLPTDQIEMLFNQLTIDLET